MSREIKAAIIVAAATLVSGLISSPLLLGWWGAEDGTEEARRTIEEFTQTKPQVHDTTKIPQRTTADEARHVEFVGQLHLEDLPSDDSAEWERLQAKQASLLNPVRNANDLKPLSDLNAQIRVSEVPPARAFLVSALELDEDVNDARAEVRGLPYGYFEVHKLSSERLVLVAFTAVETARRLSQLDRGQVQATVAPQPTEDLPALVTIPMERISEVQRIRTIPAEVYFNVRVVDLVVE